MIAIVTGGTSGIGLGVAKMLIEKGYYVYATYAHNAPTEQIENLEAIRVDQSDRKQLYAFIERIKGECDSVDCIICNAGLSIRKQWHWKEK